VSGIGLGSRGKSREQRARLGVRDAVSEVSAAVCQAGGVRGVVLAAGVGLGGGVEDRSAGWRQRAHYKGDCVPTSV
jgi:hypothetical protein